MNTPSELPLEIDVQTVKTMIDGGVAFLLLDCREQDEHDLVRIEGSRLLPMSEIQSRLGELEPHRDQRIIVHCHHGGRSLQVTHWLRGQGFADVQNMNGGIDLWAVEIEPGMTRY